MVVIKLKWQGSYTIEGAFIVSFVCIIVAWIVMIGFYVHDRSVAKSVVNELSVLAGVWNGRYMSPTTFEVDYEAMLDSAKADMQNLEHLGYQWMQDRLIYGTIQSVNVRDSFLNNNICIEIIVKYRIGGFEFEHKEQASCLVFSSEDLPRKRPENEEKE